MKDKTTAALLALFLGWFGIHRFYLRQPGLGVLYILLSFFFMISLVLGVIDAIVFLLMDPEEFDRRYNSEDGITEHDRYRQTREKRDYHRGGTEKQQSKQVHTRRQSRRPAQIHVPERRRVNPYKQEGIKKYKEYDLEGAIVDFQKGLELDARDIALHFNLACAYSLSEKVEKAYYHIDKAVEYGFKDFEKIQTHDDLAFVRIQPQFDTFKNNGFRLEPEQKPQQIEAPKEDLLQDDALLVQLNRLKELRDKGLITDGEFLAEKEKLIR